MLYQFAGAAGIEPAVPVLETGGLPLTDAPNDFPPQDGSTLNRVAENRKKTPFLGLITNFRWGFLLKPISVLYEQCVSCKTDKIF